MGNQQADNNEFEVREMNPFLASFIMWAVLHSVTAAASTKQVIRQIMGDYAYEGLYRLLYNLFAIITILPVLYLLITQVPAVPIWIVPLPFNFIMNGVQLIGLIGLAIVLWQTDIWDFAGLRQAWHYFSGDEKPIPPPKLITNGLYGFVRHPLYFFSLLFLWFNPVMGLNGLIFAIASTLYFWIGSIYEERKLLAFFGEAYRRYQQQVPRLIPFLYFRQ
jgi:protein-S-isoprenylcysteine O-methyltransferase Ste14